MKQDKNKIIQLKCHQVVPDLSDAFLSYSFINAPQLTSKLVNFYHTKQQSTATRLSKLPSFNIFVIHTNI